MTTSTGTLAATLRTQLRTFQASGSPTPDTLADVLKGQGIYVVQGPAQIAAGDYPYGIMRLQSRRRPGEYAGERETMELELQLFGRPRSEQTNIETYADIADQAMLRYLNGSSGIIFSGSGHRDTLPVMAPPADREVVAVRCVYDLIVWPVYLTQYLGS